MTKLLNYLEPLVDALHVGVVVIDEHENIVAFNPLAGEMLGQDSASRVNTSLLRCHPLRAEPGVMKMIDQMKRGELDRYQGWVNFSGRIMTEYIYPLRDKRGKYIGAVAELHDGAEKAEYLRMKGEFKEPTMHGKGESTPRTPRP